MKPDPVAENPANITDASIGIVVSDRHKEITSVLLKSAIEKAYDNVKRIHFDGQQVRSDIGAKGLKHLK